MRAGDLNQRITLQSRLPGQNVLGEATGSWADVATVWAQAQPLRGREWFAAGQMQQSTDVRFRIHWRSDVTQSMRLVWRGEPYSIDGVIDVDGGRHTLEIMATKGIRDGD